MLLIRVLILQGVLIFQGTISPLAEGTCGLRDICSALDNPIQGELSHYECYLHETSVSLMLFSLTILLVVDAFSNVQVRAPCTSNNSLWYIRRYMASDSFQPSQIMFNDSFMNQDEILTISNVSRDAEGSYHCGMNASASLCLLVRGRCTLKIQGTFGTSHFVLCTSLPSELAVIFVYCKFSFVQRVYSLRYMLMQYVI